MGVCQSKSVAGKDSGRNVQDEYKVVRNIQNNAFIVQKWNKVKEQSPRQMNNYDVQSNSQGNQDDINTSEETSQKQDQKYFMKCFVNLTPQQVSLIREDISVHKKIESQSDFYVNHIIDVYQWRESIAIIYEYFQPIENFQEEISQYKRRILSNVVLAFTFLEKQQDVYHGNISINNILINKESLAVKLTDFALNRSQHYQNLINQDNLVFRAPEWDAEKNNLKLLELGIQDKLEQPVVLEDFKKADLWSMGVVLGYLALVDNENYADLFLDHIKQKQYKDAQTLLLNHAEDYGVFFFRLLEIFPKNRISITGVNSLLSRFNLKAEIILIQNQKELEYHEYQIKKSQKESISKIHIELQQIKFEQKFRLINSQQKYRSLLLGQKLCENILELLPKLKIATLTQMHLKIQKNNLLNSGILPLTKMFTDVSFNTLSVLEINLGQLIEIQQLYLFLSIIVFKNLLFNRLNGLVGKEAGLYIQQLIQSIQAPQLTSFRLYLSMNKLGDEGACIILEEMTKMTQPLLGKIELGVGQQYIFCCFQIIFQKYELHHQIDNIIKQNDITDYGAERLGQLLTQFDMMRICQIWIYLGKNHLTYNGVDAFLNYLFQIEDKIISQSEFSFMMNNLTDEEKKDLQQRYRFNHSIRLML